MKIKEFADLCNCKTSLLRYYDEIDLLKPDKVDEETGYREYSPSQKEKYDYICALKNSGFSIEEIKSVEANPNEFAHKVEQKISELRLALNYINRFRHDFSDIEKKIDNFLAENNDEKLKTMGIYDAFKSISDDIKNGDIYNYGPDDDPEVSKKLISALMNAYSKYLK